MTRTSCPACGVVLPTRIGRCPSCGTRLGRRQLVIGLAGALMAVVVGWTLLQMRHSRRTPTPHFSVLVTPAIITRSHDDRGTDALATIENPNPMPVDVTIRVRGLDITDRAVIEKTVGPFYHLPAGGSLPLDVYLDATPLKAVTFEPLVVHPSDPDQR